VGVVDLLSEVKAAAVPDRDADFSALFAAAARESRVTPLERFANEHLTAPKDRRAQLLRRVAIAGMAVWAFVAMSSGLAYAANGAKPGDLLYGLDRAFEAVGFGDGGVTERLTEVEALITAGAISDGLEHAAAVLDGHPASDEAQAALRAAAGRLRDAPDNAGFGGDQIGNLIAYLQTAVASSDGAGGQSVAEMARELGRPEDDPTAPPADPTAPPPGPGSPTDPTTPAPEPTAPAAEPTAPAADPTAPPPDPGSPTNPTTPPTNPGPQNSDRGPHQGP
jgi:hypothetical protein